MVGGIKFGFGVFNLILLFVLLKIFKIFNMVGYFGDRELGLILFNESVFEFYLNNILSLLILFFYYSYIYVVFGVEKGYSFVIEDFFLIYF